MKSRRQPINQVAPHSEAATNSPLLLLGTAVNMPEKFTPTPDGLPEPRFGISNSLDPIHYEPRTEALVFIWNDSATTATVPDLRLDPHPKDGAVKIVRVNGRSMTEIHGDPQLQADDIFLLPLSAAERVGLVHR